MELTTTRLSLSPFTPTDTLHVFAYAKDPRVAASVTWEAHRSPSDSLVFIQGLVAKQNPEGDSAFLAWALRDPETHRAIGSISFSRHNEVAGQIDYALGANHWNKGLMTEAAAAVLLYAFIHYPKLLRIQAKCLVQNFGSRRVMEKIGMQFEGVARSAMLVKGQPADLANYAILRQA